MNQILDSGFELNEAHGKYDDTVPKSVDIATPNRSKALGWMRYGAHVASIALISLKAYINAWSPSNVEVLDF